MYKLTNNKQIITNQLTIILTFKIIRNMRNLRFLLASALLMLSLGAWAAEKHADLSIATHGGSNGTWTPATNTYAWTAGTDSRVAITDIVNEVSGDLTGWTLVVVTSGYTDDQAYRVDIKIKDNSTTKQKSFYSDGKKELSLSADYSMTAEEIAKVEEIRINTGSNSGSIKIKDVYLKNDAATPFTRTCSGFTTLSSASNNCYYNTATKNFSWTGSTSNNLQIFEMEAGTLSNFRTLTLTTSNLTDGPYRVLFMNGTTTLKSKAFYSEGTKVVDLNTDTDLAGLDLSAVTSIRFAGQSAAGNLTIDPASIYLTPEEMSIVSPISGFEWYKYNDGTVYGHAQANLQKKVGASEGVSSAAVIYGPYSGNGTTAYMDVTDYDDMDVTIASGSDHVRFIYESTEIKKITNSGAKTYTESLGSITRIGNIKASGTDGDGNNVKVSAINFKKSFEPAFSATAWSFAKDVENTTVSLNRSFTADQSSTIWLPFDLTAEQAAAAGEFYEFVAFDGSNLGFNPVTEPQAYTPYLFIPASSGELFNNITTTVKAVNSSTLSATGGTATFKGVLQHIDNVKGAESGTVYGYDATNGDFVQVTGDGVSIDAFRAYIVISGGALHAPILRVSINKTPTGVENVQGENVQGTKVLHEGQLYIKYNGTMYNVQGQKVNR